MSEEKRERTVKKYYKDEYHPQYNLSRSNILLYAEIFKLKDVETIFEFGCNIGRHLNRLNNFGFDSFGMDINEKWIKEAKKNGLLAHVGNENDLQKLVMNSVDLVFTNSVLCHMPAKEAEVAINELKRIARRYVIFFECVTKDEKFWWVHDYEKHGFKRVLSSDSHLKGKNGATYNLYLCEL
ncbi:MAG: class I SAM-dependent methyltransferase [Cycloclasticus sp.]|nr:class I SAM-dependent methyltransferase [Cycloclasticus sp.]